MDLEGGAWIGAVAAVVVAILVIWQAYKGP